MSDAWDAAGPVPAGHLRVTTTSLEMRPRPEAALAAPCWPPGCRIERAVRPGLGFYRFLDTQVGEDWLWHERRRWSDEALLTRISDPAVEVWVLTADGQPAGYAELDVRLPQDVELSYLSCPPSSAAASAGACCTGPSTRPGEP